MIGHLTGVLYSKTPQSVIIHAGGVGYEVLVPLSTYYALPEKNESVSLHIYTHVREDALALFGFHTRLEKDLFLLLISVNGIGPKLGLNVLSGMGPDDLVHAIAGADSNRLQSIPGVGKKIAERIALELRDKASRLLGQELAPAPEVIGDVEKRLLDDALSALVNLGYTAKAAKQAVDKARASMGEASLEGLIREALRRLAA
jgi:Holliday junction DNA helicase RuvA